MPVQTLSDCCYSENASCSWYNQPSSSPYGGLWYTDLWSWVVFGGDLWHSAFFNIAVFIVTKWKPVCMTLHIRKLRLYHILALAFVTCQHSSVQKLPHTRPHKVGVNSCSHFATLWIKDSHFLSWLLFAPLLWHFVVKSVQIDCFKVSVQRGCHVSAPFMANQTASHPDTFCGCLSVACFRHCSFLYPHVMVTPSSPNKVAPAVMEGK